MKVFKFGGASLKSAPAIQNVTSIIKSHSRNQLLVVVSAMGKTTDALEKIISLSQAGKSFAEEFHNIKEFHFQIVNDLFKDPKKITDQLNSLFDELQNRASQKSEYDFVYDQVIGFGEIISSTIVHHFFLQEGLPSEWIDSRKYIHTDSTYREGQVEWNATGKKIKALEVLLNDKVIITQGFIGSNSRGETVSLGREGSDFTAAIYGSSLLAESVTIWKDVPGVMSADPKRLPNAIVFEELPYKETAEMAYYGASVIHPKTVKPLANKGIPLLVKSFVDSSLDGTKIHECHVDKLPPLIVHKENQCLISCKVTDYSFINEEQLGIIFQTISESGIRINMMQNSAISFSFCVDYRENRVLKLIETLSENFEVYYNSGLTLITVKNYDSQIFDEYRNLKGVILEQSSRAALQVLVKDFK
ncbi:MAG: aspartate kinase [Bacteroidetes bacterium]|nr:aspartate kinase [Bacteroidota bacterium]MBI3482911.1 aspartate kinase [Bacteroidota bacterium]